MYDNHVIKLYDSLSSIQQKVISDGKFTMVCLMSAHNVIALSGVILYLIFILTYHSICYNYYIEIVSCLHSNISFLTDSSHCMWLNQMYMPCYVLQIMPFYVLQIMPLLHWDCVLLALIFNRLLTLHVVEPNVYAMLYICATNNAMLYICATNNAMLCATKNAMLCATNNAMLCATYGSRPYINLPV